MGGTTVTVTSLQDGPEFDPQAARLFPTGAPVLPPTVQELTLLTRLVG